MKYQDFLEQILIFDWMPFLTPMCHCSRLIRFAKDCSEPILISCVPRGRTGLYSSRLKGNGWNENNQKFPALRLNLRAVVDRNPTEG